VQLQDVPIVLEGVGTVQALYTATIRSQVTGTLEEVGFSEGEKVKRGQVLAQIDPHTFQAQLDQASATRSRDQAHLDNAKANLGRFKPLLKQGYATGQHVDTKTAQVTQLENTVKADEAAIDAARTELSDRSWQYRPSQRPDPTGRRHTGAANHGHLHSSFLRHSRSASSLGAGFVTLPNRTRSNSAGTLGSRRGDDFVPCLHRRGPKGSVRSCRCKMTLDVEGVMDCCMH
jgi:Biotin-lipoyl like